MIPACNDRLCAPRVAVAAVLATALAVSAQPGRIDTGLKLRMSDSLSGPLAPRQGESLRADTEPGPLAEVEDSRQPRLRGLSLLLTSGIRFDGNVYRTDTDERRDEIVVLQPKVYLDGRIGRHDVHLGYEGDLARYTRISSENFFNHDFVASTDLDFERRLKARLESGLAFGTDARGDLESRDAVGGEPDRWREHRLGGEVILGRRIATAQVGLRYGVRGLRYLNNRQQGRDLDERGLGLTGRYNLGPRFSILSELSGSWIDYLDPLSTLDSREFVGLLGVAWEATAKTSGEIKVGMRRREFYAFGVPAISGMAWDARVTWAPKTYSQFTAYTSRTVTDSAFDGSGGTSAATSDTYGLRWRHGFSERLRFEAGIERTLAEFVSGGEDEFIDLDAGIRYRMSRAVDMVGIWRFSSRSASTVGGDFEAGTVFVGFEAHLDGLLTR